MKNIEAHYAKGLIESNAAPQLPGVKTYPEYWIYVKAGVGVILGSYLCVIVGWVLYTVISHCRKPEPPPTDKMSLAERISYISEEAKKPHPKENLQTKEETTLNLNLLQQ